MSSGALLRVAVAGFGTMGRKHTVNCNDIDGVAVVAISGADEAEADLIRTEAKVPAFSDAAEMLSAVPFDALVVATPPGVRREMVMAAAAAGKAIFIEKPIALDLATAQGYRRAVSDNAVVNAAGFQLRYSPLTERARELITGRVVTHVRTAVTTEYYLKMEVPRWFLQRRHSGGPLLEQAIHVFDMARHLVGDITHVFARADRLTYPDVAGLDSEDTIALLYRFDNGALGTHLDSCAMTEFNWEIELFGVDWRLLVDFARKRLSGYVGSQAVDEQFEDVDLHVREMRAFVAAARSGGSGDIRSDFADATETLAVVLAGDRSIKTGLWETVER
ncbi:MAG: Gfo/Idh/MocA family oxidoreductase [Dehalococcoidales bacterium]